MHDTLGLSQQITSAQVKPLRQVIQPGEYAERLIMRRGCRFDKRGLAFCIDCDQIGKGTADIDAYVIHSRWQLRVC